MNSTQIGDDEKQRSARHATPGGGRVYVVATYCRCGRGRLAKHQLAWPQTHKICASNCQGHSFVFYHCIENLTAAITRHLHLVALAAMEQELGQENLLCWFLDLVALAQPGQSSGSLLLDFSLFGEAMAHLFNLLDHQGLIDQWDASPNSRHCHTYAFLFWIHQLLAEMHHWFTSIPLVFHAMPTNQPQSSMMVLSLMIVNHRSMHGNLWNQHSDWFKIVGSIFWDQFDSSETLHSTLPSSFILLCLGTLPPICAPPLLACLSK